MDRRPIRATEHETVFLVVTGERHALLRLALAVRLEDRCRAFVERDHPPAARRLGCPDLDPVIDADDRLPDRREPCVEVEVGPPEPEQLASAQPGVGVKMPRRVEVVVGDEPEESAEFVGSPRLHLGERQKTTISIRAILD